MNAGVWVDGKCVGVVPDGPPSVFWPIAPRCDVIYDALTPYEITVAHCRREYFAIPLRGGFWTSRPVYVDGDRSKVAITNGLAVLRACSLS